MFRIYSVWLYKILLFGIGLATFVDAFAMQPDRKRPRGEVVVVDDDDDAELQEALRRSLQPSAGDAAASRPVAAVSKPKIREIMQGSVFGRVFTFIENSKIKSNETQILNLVPAIGVYGNPINIRKPLLLCELSSDLLQAHVPKTLSDELAKYSNVQKSFCAVMHGPFPVKVLKQNMFFHGFLADCIPPVAGKIRSNLKMGVFGTQGISNVGQKDSMPFDKLQERDVHFHDKCLSPNNAHIGMIDGRSIASFWSVIVSPDGKRVAVTYNVLINHVSLAQTINAYLSQSMDFPDLEVLGSMFFDVVGVSDEVIKFFELIPK